MYKPKAHILIGNIGSGKSTLSKTLRAISTSKDDYRFVNGKYVFDLKREKEVREKFNRGLIHLIDLNIDIAIDNSENMSFINRSYYVKLLRNCGYEIIYWVMPDYIKEICVANRMKDNHGKYSAQRWNEVWEMFNDMYDPPITSEYDRVYFLSNREGDQ